MSNRIISAFRTISVIGSGVLAFVASKSLVDDTVLSFWIGCVFLCISLLVVTFGYEGRNSQKWAVCLSALIFLWPPIMFLADPKGVSNQTGGVVGVAIIVVSWLLTGWIMNMADKDDKLDDGDGGNKESH